MKRNTGLANFLLVAILATTGCTAATGGPDDDGQNPTPTEGHAFLTVVGERNVFLEAGARQQITVKYHDEDGDPLAGLVEFAVLGDAKGGNVSSGSGVTNAEGLVTIEVFAGSQAEALFTVKAEAEYATAVDWRVAVAAGQPPVLPLTVTGTYQLDSQFNIVDGLPGTVGTVVNTILDMTDDPTDPATWLIDKAMENVDSDTIRDLVDALRPGLDGYLNDVLLSSSPGFVSTFVNVANDLGQVARKFGVTSTLAVTQGGPDASELHAQHTMTGLVFVIDGVRYEYTMAELSMSEVVSNDIQAGLVAETKLTVGDHTLPVSYGAMLMFALDHIIIPAIDPWSHSLEELFNAYVDCATIGWTISDYVGWGSPGLYESACQTALAAAAAYVEDQIRGIDGTATALVIHGEAKPVDTNGDRTVDKLQGGLWEGVIQFGSLESVLAKPDQKFVGERIGVP